MKRLIAWGVGVSILFSASALLFPRARVGYLASSLVSVHHQEQVEAVVQLGILGPEASAAVPALLELTRDPNPNPPDTRGESLWALGRIAPESPEVRIRARDLLARDSNDWVRGNAATVLLSGDIRLVEKDVPLLLSTLLREQKVAPPRDYAAFHSLSYGLAHLARKDPTVRPAIQAALEEGFRIPEQNVRITSGAGLWELDPVRARALGVEEPVLPVE